MTSRELEEPLAANYARLGMRPGLLEDLTGVRARRFWDPGIKPSDGAALAGRRVTETCGVDGSRIGS